MSIRYIALSVKSILLFGHSKLAIGGNVLLCNDKTAFIKEKIPAAASRCPILGLRELIPQNCFLFVYLLNALCIPSISTGSPK